MQTEVHYAAGRLTVADPRVFHAGRRTLASLLIRELAACTDVRTALLDLETGDLRIDWPGAGYPPDRAAAVFTEALQSARRAESKGKEKRRFPFERVWTVWMTHRLAGGPIVLRARQTQAGRVCIRLVTAPTQHAHWDTMLDAVGNCAGIHALRVRRWPEGLDVDFDPTQLSREQVLDAVADAWQAKPLELTPESLSAGRAFMVRGPRRLLYLATGCGSFVMSIVGLVVPGVPTVPFLLASSYYFARSSRTLHRKLLDSRLFGRMLQEWETHRAMSRASKRRLAGFTLTVILISVAFAPLSPMLLVMVAVMSAICLYGIGRIPELNAPLPLPSQPA